MKLRVITCLLALALTASLTSSALAAQTPTPAPAPAPCYPTSVSRSEDGREIRKTYDLGPEEDPAGIARSDFDQEGFHYTFLDLLKQEAPEFEQRDHTETVTVPSKSKDMGAVLTLLPPSKDITTEDGLMGTLTLQLESVKVETAGYGSSTQAVSTTRSYPNLADQDTQYIPKTVQEGGNTLNLQTINWQTQADGHFTATVTYTGTTTSSYVTGYTVTAEYVGTVSRINLNKVRYIAVFDGTPLVPVTPEPEPEPEQEPESSNNPTKPESHAVVPAAFNWFYLLAPLGLVALIGVGVGVAIFLKRRNENEEDEEDDEE